MATSFLVHENIWFAKVNREDPARGVAGSAADCVQAGGPAKGAGEELARSPVRSPAAPQPQRVSPVRQAEDKEADRLWEERLRQYTEKPALVAKPSILDIKPWDDEMVRAWLEACVPSVQLDRLTCSKLMPVGHGIHRLQVLCVKEDDKVGTGLLEEGITKSQEHMQSVHSAAFNKI
ncbi:hypothetical protein CB1_001683004 [Camelus ferus]|nr:hypothetical protein CB1_001683004 [Camelus ferus]